MGQPQPIALPGGGLVISDLHLDAASAAEHGPFHAFLAACRGARALLILGDLFDAWVGPAHARLPGASGVVAALRGLADSGVQIALIPGNRDFLLGPEFARAAGVQLCPDGILATAGDGSRVLFLHGDELCTRDRSYQRLKRVVRSAPVRWLAPRLPDALALGVARRLRRASTAAVQKKPPEEKLQQLDESRARAAAAQAGTLVCGHAHRFRDEALGEGGRWIVLDAFGGERDLLVLGPGGALEARGTAAFARSAGARA